MEADEMMVLRLAELKAEIEAKQSEFNELRKSLLGRMEDEGVDNVAVTWGEGTDVIATKYTTSRVEYDVEQLAVILHNKPKLFNKLTEVRVNGKAVEAAFGIGEITLEQLRGCSHVNNYTNLRIREKKHDSDDNPG